MKFVAIRKHAQDISDGHLYMNSLGYFWDSGTREQCDIFEGTSAVLKNKNTGFTQDFVDVNAYDMRVRLSAYRYVSLFCCYRLDFDEQTGILNLPNKAIIDGLGNYAVVIIDEDSFCRRIIQKASEEKYDCICGDVRYHTPMKDGQIMNPRNTLTMMSHDEIDLENVTPVDSIRRKMDCFDKWAKFRHQNEWRICLNRMSRDAGHVVYDVGDLSSIVRIYSANEFPLAMVKFFKPDKIGEVAEQSKCFRGNVTRKQFAEGVQALKPGKGHILAIIG